jgi:hypothetical protein
MRVGQRRLALLGGQLHFERNSRPLLRLVAAAYAGLPLPADLFLRRGRSG